MPGSIVKVDTRYYEIRLGKGKHWKHGDEYVAAYTAFDCGDGMAELRLCIGVPTKEQYRTVKRLLRSVGFTHQITYRYNRGRTREIIRRLR